MIARADTGETKDDAVVSSKADNTQPAPTPEASHGNGDHVMSPTPLPVCVSLHDIEREAQRVLSRRAWIYYSSASEDLSSLRNNLDDWDKIRFRARVLRNVARVTMNTTIMGFESALPFFIAPMALGKLAHPDGELGFVNGAAVQRIPYCVSMLASVSHEDLTGRWRTTSADDTALFFQLYVAKEEQKARETVRRAKRLGYKALAVTVDTPVVGKREDDERDKLQKDYDLGLLPDVPDVQPDVAGEKPILRGVNSSTLNWTDLSWIIDEWGDRDTIMLKGIGAAEDAKLAQSLGFKHLYLSNHGGRQIPSASSPITTLLEIRRFFPEVLDSCEVYLDGGLRRGSDIVKALCLGATAVGIGRPFMYGLGAFGEAGVRKVIQSQLIDPINSKKLTSSSVLSDEIETTMRLLGVTSTKELGPALVNARRLEKYMSTSIDMNELSKL